MKCTTCLVLPLCLFLAVLQLGCEGSGSSESGSGGPTPEPVSFVGTWDAVGGPWTGVMTLSQNGIELSGTASGEGESGTVSGTINGSSASFTALLSGGTTTGDGTLNPDGTLSGSYVCPTSSGAWMATRR